MLPEACAVRYGGRIVDKEWVKQLEEKLKKKKNNIAHRRTGEAWKATDIQ